MAIYSVADWDKATGALAGSALPIINTLRGLLQKYHAAAKLSADARAALHAIVTTCQSWKGSGDLNGPILMLRLSAERRLKLIGGYQDYVAAADKYYNSANRGTLAGVKPNGPGSFASGVSMASQYVSHSNTANVAADLLLQQGRAKAGDFVDPRFKSASAIRAQTLQLTMGFHAGSSKHNTWLEAADPLHRMWGKADDRIFNEWASGARELDFFTWVERNKQNLIDRYDNDPANPGRLDDLLNTDKGVKYLDSAEKFRYRIKFEKGLIKQRNPKSMTIKKGDADLRLFSTRELRTEFSGDGWAIWVCSVPEDSKKKRAKFYSHKHRLGRFHHSTFLAGRDVLCGGEWVVAEGQLLLVTNKTGHYWAQPDNLHSALKELAAQLGRDALAETLCGIQCINPNTNQYVYRYVWAVDFIDYGPDPFNVGTVDEVSATGGGPDQWKALASAHGMANKNWSVHRQFLNWVVTQKQPYSTFAPPGAPAKPVASSSSSSASPATGSRARGKAVSVHKFDPSDDPSMPPPPSTQGSGRKRSGEGAYTKGLSIAKPEKYGNV
jgi:hypothetical protein